ncbi:hypothetical protein HaLaN_13126, partial [Haematococcus lacustris]
RLTSQPLGPCQLGQAPPIRVGKGKGNAAELDPVLSGRYTVYTSLFKTNANRMVMRPCQSLTNSHKSDMPAASHTQAQRLKPNQVV